MPTKNTEQLLNHKKLAKKAVSAAKDKNIILLCGGMLS